MKYCQNHIFSILSFLLISSMAHAQENSYPESMEPETKSSYMPGGESQRFESTDSIFFRPAPQPRISESAKDATSSEGSKEDEEDDSVISFNFLYYIIQKFKMSDIVDP